MENEGNISQYSIMLVNRNGKKMNRIEIHLDESDVEKYINIMNKLVYIRHRNILLYESYSYNQNLHKFYIYTKYLKNGNLKDELNKKRITESDIPQEV